MRRFSGVASTIFACTGLAACGKTVAYTDAGSTDAPDHDAMTVTGSVTVTTNARCCDRPPGTPVSGVEVFVNQPDGSLGDSGQTDGTGSVTLDDVREGAGVTAIYQTADGYDLVTVVGVAPGDDLVFGEDFRPDQTGVAGSMTVSWPALPAVNYYYVYHPCGGTYANNTQTSVVLNQYVYCQTPTADLQVIAYDTSYNLSHAVVLRDVPYTNGQTASVGAWTPATQFTVSASNIPSVIDEVQLGAGSVVDDIVSLNHSTYQTPAGGGASAIVPVATGTDRVAAWSRISHPGDLGSQLSFQSLPATATSATFPLVELPWLGDAIVSASGRIATWVQVGDQPYDGAVVSARWERSVGEGGEGGSWMSYEWTVLLPPGVTTWSWADPPAALADIMPVATDSFYGDDILLVDLAGVDDYAALRSTPEWHFACPDCAVTNGEIDAATFSYGDGGEGFAETDVQRRPPWLRGPATAPAPGPR